MAMINLKPSVPTVKLGINNYAFRPMLPRPSLRISQAQAGVKQTRHVKDLGDILLGNPISGTKQLRDTLEDYNMDAYKYVPLLNRLIGTGIAAWERQLEPLSRGKVGEAFINTMETLGNSLDIVANPVKSLMPWAGGGSLDDFYKSMGWIESAYRETYQWNTGSFVLDMVGEYFSDPMNWLSFGAEGVIKQTSKSMMDDAAEIITKNYTRMNGASKALTNDLLIAAVAELDAEGVESIVKVLQNNYKTLQAQLKNVTSEDVVKVIKAKLENYGRAMADQQALIQTISDIRNLKGYRYYANAIKLKDAVEQFNKGLKQLTNFILPMNYLVPKSLQKVIVPTFSKVWNKYVSQLPAVLKMRDVIKVDQPTVQVTKRKMRAELNTVLNATLKTDWDKLNVKQDVLADKYIKLWYDLPKGKRSKQNVAGLFIDWLLSDESGLPKETQRLAREAFGGSGISSKQLQKLIDEDLIHKADSLLSATEADDNVIRAIASTVMTAEAEIQLNDLVELEMHNSIRNDYKLLTKEHKLTKTEEHYVSMLTRQADYMNDEYDKLTKAWRKYDNLIPTLKAEVDRLATKLQDADSFKHIDPKRIKSFESKLSEVRKEIQRLEQKKKDKYIPQWSRMRKQITEYNRQIDNYTKQINQMLAEGIPDDSEIIKEFTDNITLLTQQRNSLEKAYTNQVRSINRWIAEYTITRDELVQQLNAMRITNFTTKEHIQELYDKTYQRYQNAIKRKDEVVKALAELEKSLPNINKQVSEAQLPEAIRQIMFIRDKMKEELGINKFGTLVHALASDKFKSTKLNLSSYNTLFGYFGITADNHALLDYLFERLDYPNLSPSQRRDIIKQILGNLSCGREGVLTTAEFNKTLKTVSNAESKVAKAMNERIEIYAQRIAEAATKPENLSKVSDAFTEAMELREMHDVYEMLVVLDKHNIADYSKVKAQLVGENNVYGDPFSDVWKFIKGIRTYKQTLATLKEAAPKHWYAEVPQEMFNNYKELQDLYYQAKKTINNYWIQYTKGELNLTPDVEKVLEQLHNAIRIGEKELVDNMLRAAWESLETGQTVYIGLAPKLRRFDIGNAAIISSLGEDRWDALTDAHSTIRKNLDKVITVTDTNEDYAGFNLSLRKLIALVDNTANINRLLNNTCDILDIDDAIANHIRAVIFDVLDAAEPTDFRDIKNLAHRIIAELRANSFTAETMQMLEERNFNGILIGNLKVYIDKLEDIRETSLLGGTLTNTASLLLTYGDLNILNIIDDIGGYNNIIEQLMTDELIDIEVGNSVLDNFASLTSERWVNQFKKLANDLEGELGSEIDVSKFDRTKMTLADAIVEALRGIKEYSKRWNSMNEDMWDFKNKAIKSEMLRYDKKTDKWVVQDVYVKEHARPVGSYILKNKLDALLRDILIEDSVLSYMNKINIATGSRGLGYGVKILIQNDKTFQEVLNPSFFKLDADSFKDSQLYNKFYTTYRKQEAKYAKRAVTAAQDILDSEQLYRAKQLAYFFKHNGIDVFNDAELYFKTLDKQQLDIMTSTIYAGGFGDDVRKKFDKYMRETVFENDINYDALLNEEALQARIENYELYNQLRITDALNDDNLSMTQKIKIIEDSEASNYPNALQEWYVIESQRDMKDPSLLKEHRREFDMIYKRNGIEYSKLEKRYNALREKYQHDTVYNKVKLTNVEKNTLAEKYHINKNTKLTSHRYGKYMYNERYLNLVDNVLSMTPEQLRAYIDSTDGMLFFMNNEQRSFLNYNYIEQLKDVGIELVTSDDGRMTVLRRTDNINHVLNYNWTRGEYLTEDIQQRITDIIRQDDEALPWDILTGDTLDADVMVELLKSDKLSKYLGDEEVQLLYRTLNAHGKFAFYNTPRANLMIIGADNPINSFYDYMVELGAMEAPLYPRSSSVYKTMLNGTLKQIADDSAIHKAAQWFFNDDMCMASPWMKEWLLELSNEQIQEMFGNYGNKACALRVDKDGNAHVYNILVNDKKTLQQAIDAKACILPYDLAKSAMNIINTKKEPSKIMEIYRKVAAPIFKSVYLNTPGFLMRNFLDTSIVKNSISTNGIPGLLDNFEYQLRASKLLKQYNEIDQKILDYSKQVLGHESHNAAMIRAILAKLSPEERYNYILTHAFMSSSGAMGMSKTVKDYIQRAYDLKVGRGDAGWEEVVQDLVRGNIVSRSFTDVNEWIEDSSRFGLYLNLLEHGTDASNSIKRVLETHFDYGRPYPGQSLINDIFWFSTFPLNNIAYYINKGLDNNLDVLKLQLKASALSWNNGEYTWEDVKKSNYLTYNVMAGNIRFKFAGKNILLKTGSSAYDFFNMLLDPADAVTERLNPFLGVLFGTEPISQLNPVQSLIDRFSQQKIPGVKDGTSYAPSIYTELTQYPKRGKIQRSYNIGSWNKYPKKYYPKKPKRMVKFRNRNALKAWSYKHKLRLQWLDTTFAIEPVLEYGKYSRASARARRDIQTLRQKANKSRH